jgi:antitoxin component YwqK of YwqJK toxin-antitoxin module
MVKINSFIAILLLTVGMFSCKRPGRKIERYKNGMIGIIYEYPDKRDTNTYTYVENYPNGRLHKQFSVQHNMIVGSPTIYYPNGTIYQIDSAFHQRNVYSQFWDGITKRYYKNGTLLARLPVKKGVFEGLTKTFNEKGVLLKEYFLIHDSIKNGPYTEFYPDGTISVKATFNNGLLDGMMYYFDEKGDTSKYYNCDKGDIVMPYKKWLDNGNTLYGDYADESEKAVTWKWYTKEGKLIKKERRYLRNGGFVAPE